MKGTRKQKIVRTPLLDSLGEISSKYPREEKILITPDYRLGQQVLQSLVRSGTPWMNFRMAAASALASDIAEERIVSSGLRRVSGPGILAIIDDLFRELFFAGELRYFERHETNTGMNHALTGAIMELRTKGIRADNIKEKAFVSPDKARDIRLLLSGYEKYLEEKKLIDKAGLTMLAAECLVGYVPVPGRKYIIFSRYYMSGLERQFIERLAGPGLMVLEDGQVFGLKGPKGMWQGKGKTGKIKSVTDSERLMWTYAPEKAPDPTGDGTIELFSAIGFRNEIREIFRRIIGAGIPGDDVEIVYTDPVVYVREIFCLCEKLKIPATFSEGIPGHTRSPFRAIRGFLDWIRDDFTEMPLRRMLEGEDILPGTPAGSEIDGPRLGHLLRLSGVGWGRERYARVLEKRAAEYAKRAREPIDDEDLDLREVYERDARDMTALKALCEALLELVPAPDSEGEVSLRELCDGCIKFLKENTIARGAQDEAFVSDAAARISAIGQYGAEKVDLAKGVEKITGTVSTIKVGSSGPRPGHVHVSHYKHGGRTGRPFTFVVGLDEFRFPGRALQDPILLDIEREKIDSDMEMSTDAQRKNVYDMASMLSGLRGKVTASYSAFDVKDERKVFPSSLMLQIYRLREGKPSADYEDMLRGLGRPLSTTSISENALPLDLTEWWICRLASDEVVKNGIRAVENVYPGIKRGIAAEEARQSPLFTEYDGKVNPSGTELDPREDPGIVLSCSRLEKAAECPFKYFLSNVLGVEKPRETAKDPAMWLDPMQKGCLLHKVFEDFTKHLRSTGWSLPAGERREAAFSLLRREAERYLDEIPPPNDMVYEGEYLQMKRDLEIFLSIEEQLGTRPVYEELRFGTGETSPVLIPLGDGRSINLRGIIDRVDKAGEREYHIWDYKTGSSRKYDERQYVKGGEILQHALYACAAETVLKAKGEDQDPKVTRAGYLLASEKGAEAGKGIIFARDPSRKDKWQKALNTLLELLSRGGFLIPQGASCIFCDYRVVCGDEETRDRAKIKKDSDDICSQLWRELKQYE